MTRVYVGLGSNLGDREQILRAAAEALDWGEVRVVARSSVYETDPVGGPPGQPRFLNQVIALETTLGARALLERCLAIEAALGRAREHEERWGPRPIDVDVLLFGEEEIEEPDLRVPHPLMRERAFVLVPLAEIDPSVRIPGGGTAEEALRALGRAGGIRAFR